MLSILLGAVAAYLVGCVPIASFVRHLVAGRPWADAAVIAADFIKGFGVMAFLSPDASALGQALVLAAVVAGEQWPIVGGDTGKVAFWTAFGAFAALTPIAPVIFGVAWGIGFVTTGYLAVGRLAGVTFTWLCLGVVAGWPLGLAALPASWLVLQRLQPDYARWRRGDLPKLHWNSDA